MTEQEHTKTEQQKEHCPECGTTAISDGEARFCSVCGWFEVAALDESKINMEEKSTDELESLADEKRTEIGRLKRERKAIKDEISTRETAGPVTPETFEKVAWAIYNGESFSGGHRSDNYENGVRENGFVHASVMGSGALVGIREGESKYIIAEMQSRTETLGQGRPRLKTTRNEYVSAEFMECEYEGQLDDTEKIKEAFEDGEYIDRGSLKGSGATSIGDVLDEIFRYYSEVEV